MGPFEDWQIWFIAGISFITLETLIPGFVIAGVGIACLFAALGAYVGMGHGLQGLILFTGAGLFFLTIRPIVMKYLYASNSDTRTNTAALIGKIAIVTKPIVPHTTEGRVSVEGSSWIGISLDNTNIEQGEITEIVEVSGTTLTVKRKETVQ